MATSELLCISQISGTKCINLNTPQNNCKSMGKTLMSQWSLARKARCRKLNSQRVSSVGSCSQNLGRLRPQTPLSEQGEALKCKTNYVYVQGEIKFHSLSGRGLFLLLLAYLLGKKICPPLNTLKTRTASLWTKNSWTVRGAPTYSGPNTGSFLLS